MMAQLERVSVRLSRVQLDQLRQLSDRLQLDQANVIRFAITRLAQFEGVVKGPPMMEIVLKMERTVALIEERAKAKGIDLNADWSRTDSGHE